MNVNYSPSKYDFLGPMGGGVIVYFEVIGNRLTGLCPGDWVSYGHSAPEQGPGDCVPIWS